MTGGGSDHVVRSCPGSGVFGTGVGYVLAPTRRRGLPARGKCGYACGHTVRGCDVRTVGVREFRDQATSLMAAGETLVIERHGEPIGFFVPITAKDRRAGRAALGRLGELVDDVLAQAGVGEEELVRGVSTRHAR